MYTVSAERSTDKKFKAFDTEQKTKTVWEKGITAMDRRQRKTREAVFSAFTELLRKKEFEKITVGEIIERADVGRATFYALFETKDDLLKALCEELFCHLFDSMGEKSCGQHHIFDCDAPSSPFLHLFRHLQKDDNRILTLLSCQSNGLFLRLFESRLRTLAERQLPLFAVRKHKDLPDDFWISHIASTFTETLRWWIGQGMKESAETVTRYFMLAV